MAELHLPNYPRKSYARKATGVDKSSFSKKFRLANLKSDVEKLDINKVKTAPTHLSKLDNVVKNKVVKKIVYDKLVTKVSAIDTWILTSKTDYGSFKKIWKIYWACGK